MSYWSDGLMGAKKVGDVSIDFNVPVKTSWSSGIESPIEVVGINRRSQGAELVPMPLNSAVAGSAKPAAAPPQPSEPTKKLSVAIPSSLHKTLKQRALDVDLTMGELISQLLRQAIDDQNKEEEEDEEGGEDA